MKLVWRPVELSLKETFVSHKGLKPQRLSQMAVELHWRGRSGLGWAVPAPDYGTDLDGIDAALAACAPKLCGRTPTELERLLDDLEAICGRQTSALAAMDMALHDLLGQMARMPVRDLLGCAPTRSGLPDTFASIGMMSPEQAREKALSLQGWSRIKLKMGTDPDYARVRAVREVFGGLLAVDGNGAWSPQRAPAILRALADVGVDLVEQPIAPGDHAALKAVSAASPIPVLADEDCVGPDSILRLQGCVQGVNIKLLKCGGLRRALKMIWLARHFGMRVMLGCKVESSIGVTAMAQLGALADWLDLDGHLPLADDPYTGLTIDHGRIHLPHGAGLGLTSVATPRLFPDDNDHSIETTRIV
ncbi:MAG: dipeptide epimerase [Lysobacteraceae bacterium]|nr:MAG: dipeptide epimerase [Xanthomonadaceae bacterium]